MRWLRGSLRTVFSKYYKARFRRGEFACIRVNIRRNKWEGKSPDDPQHVREAIKDLEVKPKDLGGLSIYVTRSLSQARHVALIHQITNNSPDKNYFLFAPATCLTELSCNLQITRQWDWVNQARY